MNLKKFLYIPMLLSCAFISKAQTGSIVIEGTLTGVDSGELVLTVQTAEDKPDTIARAPFKSSHFTINSELNEPVVARLGIVGYNGGFELIAEPGATYSARLKDGADAAIQGGTLQMKWLQYQQTVGRYINEVNATTQRYEALMRESRFRSASRCNDTLVILKNELTKFQKEFLEDNDNIISAHIAQVTSVRKNMSLSESREIYESLGANARNTQPARLLKERVDRLQKTAHGQKAPDFSMPDPQGQMITISQVKAKIKIVDFWASWCGPCRLNNQVMKGIYADFHDKGLEIIGVSLDDDKSKWMKAIDKQKLPWINISDLKAFDSEVAKLYDVSGIPALFILDEDNNIIGKDIKGEALRIFLDEKIK